MQILYGVVATFRATQKVADASVNTKVADVTEPLWWHHRSLHVANQRIISGCMLLNDNSFCDFVLTIKLKIQISLRIIGTFFYLFLNISAIFEAYRC